MFEDVNANGVQDPGEPGIEGVDVVITDSNGETFTLTTDQTGMYMAEVPPGPTALANDAVGPGGMTWLVAGGLSYTIGAAFYAAKRLAFSHAIWHVFVLLGGICHFLAVIWHVLPVSPELAIAG